MKRGIQGKPKYLKVGDLVKSHFRAKWQGEVVEDVTGNQPIWWQDRYPCTQLLVVRIDVNRYGRVMRKPVKMELGRGWLEKINQYSINNHESW